MTSDLAWLLPLASPILGGGLLVALIKLRPERDNIIVASAKATVELAWQAQQHTAAELREAKAEIGHLEDAVRALRVDVASLRDALQAATGSAQ